MDRFHLAEVNIARARHSLDAPEMQSFIARLDEINALADGAAGFVWRFQTNLGSAGYLRPYEDDRILVNLSVWESAAALKEYTYRTAHAELLRDRQQWFEHLDGFTLALWWVPVGHVPSVHEARQRLLWLQERGPSPLAFTFKTIEPPDEAALAAFDWSMFGQCAAG